MKQTLIDERICFLTKYLKKLEHIAPYLGNDARRLYLSQSRELKIVEEWAILNNWENKNFPEKKAYPIYNIILKDVPPYRIVVDCDERRYRNMSLINTLIQNLGTNGGEKLFYDYLDGFGYSFIKELAKPTIAPINFTEARSALNGEFANQQNTKYLLKKLSLISRPSHSHNYWPDDDWDLKAFLAFLKWIFSEQGYFWIMNIYKNYKK